MKFLILIISLVGSVAMADITVYPEYKDDAGSCIPSTHFNHRISQKINANLYELQGDGISSRPRALLKTKKAVFDKTGFPVGLGIKLGENQDMPLTNGFSASYTVWEECGMDVSLVCKANSDPFAAWPRKPKDLNCSDMEKYIEKISKPKSKTNKKKK